MNADDYLDRPCQHDINTRLRCVECRCEEAVELLALRAREAAIDAEAPGLMAENAKLRDALDSLRDVLHELASAGVQYDAGKYLVVQISHETMAEARRMTR